MKRTLLLSLFIFTKLVLIDQVTKIFFRKYLRELPGMVLEITPFLDIVYEWNYGISFGLFSNYYQYSNLFFLFFNGIICTILFYAFLLQSKDKIELTCYLTVLAGAIGNLIDRIVNGAVFDFISFHYGKYYFPVFNLADAYSCVAVGILITRSIFDSQNRANMLHN